MFENVLTPTTVVKLNWFRLGKAGLTNRQEFCIVEKLFYIFDTFLIKAKLEYTFYNNKMGSSTRCY